MLHESKPSNNSLGTLDMKRRRVRATFLLRCVILAACVALFAVAAYLTRSLWFVAATLIVLSLIWFIGIEGGLLPEMIEHWLARRAAQSEKAVDSIWFVDLDAQDDKLRESFHDESSNNPTIR